MDEEYPLSITFDNKSWEIIRTREEINQICKKLINLDKTIIKKQAIESKKTVKQVEESSETIKKKYEASKFPKKEMRKINKNAKFPKYVTEKLNEFFEFVIDRIEGRKDLLYFNEFIEFSVYSSKQSIKRKEGYVYKRTGGRHGNENRCLYLCKYCRRLQKRWLILTDSYIGYTADPTQDNFHEVLMFKDNFKLIEEDEVTGYYDALILSTNRRVFFFHAGSKTKKNQWSNAIKDALAKSDWNPKNHLFKSAFPTRAENKVTFFVDGKDYFNEVYESLKKAEESVFITDWWLSPDMYLKRPSANYPDSQIVKVLKYLAEEKKVKIFVHMYNEVTLAVLFDSLHSKEVLEKNIKENIQIIRHPQRNIMGGSFFWSHHEKIISIDQKIGFLGGLDLCFGRWDSSDHLLEDSTSPHTWNGIDYSNARTKDFINVRDYETCLIDRNRQPRMPWHDVALKIEGPSAYDLSLHFIDLWNHVMTDVTGNYYKNKKLIEVAEMKKTSKNRSEVKSLKQEIKRTLTLGNEDEDDKEARKRFRNTVNVNMDENKKSPESKISPMDLKMENIRSKLEKSTSIKNEDDARRGSFGFLNFFMKKDRSSEETAYETPDDNENENKNATVLKALLVTPVLISSLTDVNATCTCTIVRSASEWSYGLRKAESSIHTAYCHLIKNSKHFIYIENQFFISSTAGEPVCNFIAQELVKRVIKAHDNNEQFKIIVIMPLLPAFEGEIYDDAAAVLRIQLDWEYKTIVRAENSIYSQLKRKGIENPNNYIRFFGLRTHGVIKNTPVTEIVYVHSKLMIVDDNFVIIGSANVNDRSMTGIKDSEIAVVVEDTNKIDARLGGKITPCSKFALEFRRKLFKEFMGYYNYSELEDIEYPMSDPSSEEFFARWNFIAETNTKIYRDIFNCYPDDTFFYLSQIKEKSTNRNSSNYFKILNEKYYEYKDKIQGFLVEFPLNFLSAEDSLQPSKWSKEGVMPRDFYV